jgi:Fe-S-cluster-containing hydrogenase component 2
MLWENEDMGEEKPGTIVYHPNHCSACGICEVVCSLLHEGTAGPALARSNIIRDPFTAQHRHMICLQCNDPACYFACPARDKALCMDRATGVLYIDENECNGCELCIEACPQDPPRIKSNARKKVAFKCDLCRAREEGPLCVESCPFQALTIANKEG